MILRLSFFLAAAGVVLALDSRPAMMQKRDGNVLLSLVARATTCASGEKLCSDNVTCAATCCINSEGTFLGGCDAGSSCDIRDLVLRGCCPGTDPTKCDEVADCYDNGSNSPNSTAQECPKSAPYCALSPDGFPTCYVSVPGANVTIATTASSAQASTATARTNSTPTSSRNAAATVGVSGTIFAVFIAALI